MKRSTYVLIALVVAFFAGNLFLGLRTSNWDFVDENIYTRAAVTILLGHSCPLANITVPTPTVCNYEHPPLVKLLEALNLYALGWLVPNVSYSTSTYAPAVGNLSSSPIWFLAFRSFQLVMGALTLPLLYLTAYKISRNVKLALIASGLLVLEPLYAFFSRTAYLDIPMIFFALCAYAVYFGSYRAGPISQYWLSGILLALSVLSKETGVVFIVPLAVYHLLFRGNEWRSRTGDLLRIIGAEAVTGALGLQLYDTLARTPFPTFLSQIRYMFIFSGSETCNLACSLGNGPYAWFLPWFQASWTEGLSWNHVLSWLVFAWIPIGAYSIWRSGRREISPEDRLFVFASILFASTLTEDLLFFSAGRIAWIWYYLPVVPSLALGGAYFLTRTKIPRSVRFLVAALLVLGCLVAYSMGPNFLIYD